MKKLIAIGVDKTFSVFPKLNAAASGAEEVADWAKSQGFDVSLFTDISGDFVKFDSIKNEIDQTVRSGTCSQLVIYFSGHGVLLSQGGEVWLLSDAPAEAEAAINVAGSIQRARNSNIPHVVFISDACRSAPGDFITSGLTPRSFFPTQNPRAPRPEIDVFYATLPGSPALELAPDKAVDEYRGILTFCMMRALNGLEDDAVEKLTSKTQTKQVVSSRALKNHLLLAVPEHAAEKNIALTQDPDMTIESALPKYLAEITERTAPLIIANPPGSLLDGVVAHQSEPPLFPARHNRGFTRPYSKFKSKSKEQSKPKTTPLSEIPTAAKLNQTIWLNELTNKQKDNGEDKQLFSSAIPATYHSSINRIVLSRKRRSFETKTGFSVIGARVRNAWMTHGHCEIFDYEGGMAIRIYQPIGKLEEDQPNAILIEFESGIGCHISVFSGLIGNIVFDEGHIATINYTPSEFAPLYDVYRQHESTIENRRAFVATAAKFGAFRVSADSARKTADYLRQYKEVDPTLGLYAAYAYAQAGLSDEVADVYKYMQRQTSGVPFDVAMLAENMNPKNDDKLTALNFSPWLPMLTQGWLLLGDYELEMPEPIKQARKYLVPGLWTTFKQEGVDLLRDSYFHTAGEHI